MPFADGWASLTGGLSVGGPFDGKPFAGTLSACEPEPFFRDPFMSNSFTDELFVDLPFCALSSPLDRLVIPLDGLFYHSVHVKIPYSRLEHFLQIDIFTQRAAYISCTTDP